MITKPAQIAAILSNPTHTASVRVFVDDSVGDPQQLTDFVPSDPTMTVEIEETVDDHRHATITLQRQQGFYSLAPLVTNLIAGVPVTALARRIQMDVAIQPANGDIDVGVSQTTFLGYIDRIEWPDDQMVLHCSDQSAKLRDTFIERERVYGLCTGANATKGAYVWNNKSDAPPLVLNDLVLPSKLNANGHYYKVTAVVGAQSTAEPVWPTGGGATVVSGGVTLTEAGTTSTTGTAVETIMQQIINDNGLGGLFTLSTPVSPSWTITPYLQQRESVLEALELFADQIGWNLRFSKSTFALTFSAPDRAAAGAAVKTLSAAEECEFTELAIDVTEIRNVVAGVYGDASSRDGEGAPTRLRREVSDSTSISKYGRRFMEISEGSNSNIDSSSEMDAMLNAVLADLKEPTAVLSVSFPVDPYLELDDLVQIPADGLRFTSTQKLAIVGMRDRYEAKGQRTTITLAGKPVSRRSGWLGRETRVSEEGAHDLSLLDTQGPGVSIAPTIGGGRTKLTGTLFTKTPRGQGFEIHVSDSAGFTPSSATMVGNGEQAQVETANLVPGKTYYWKAVPYVRNATQKVLGAPSVEQSFVAGRARAGHYDSGSTQSHLPLNGNFEHASDDLSVAPPDHWRVVTRPAEATETWGVGGSVFHGTDSSKGRYIELRAVSSQRGNIVSSHFEIRRGCKNANIYLSIMRTGSSAASGKDLIVDVQLYADAALSSLVRSDSIFLSGDSAGPYPSLSTWYDTVIDYGGGYGALPTNANFAVVSLRRGTTGDNSFAWRIGDVYWQEADFYRANIDQPAFTAASFATNWGDVGAGYQTTGYLKDSMGFVHLRGQPKVTTGTLTATIFTLPAGSQPSAIEQYWVRMGTGVGSYIEIDTSGNVKYQGGVLADAQSGTSLAGITFKAA